MAGYIKLKSSEDLHKYDDSALPNLYPCMIADEKWVILDRTSKGKDSAYAAADAKSGFGQWLHLTPAHYGDVANAMFDPNGEEILCEEFPEEEPVLEATEFEASEVTEDFAAPTESDDDTQ